MQHSNKQPRPAAHAVADAGVAARLDAVALAGGLVLRLLLGVAEAPYDTIAPPHLRYAPIK